MTAPAPSTPPASTANPDDRATGFTAVDPNAEHYDGNALVVYAYAGLWIVLMGWIYLLWRKQAGLGERLTDLERTLDRAAAAAEKKAKAGAS
ncbi:MAG: hypothetical protein JWP97_5014 [Labilithrix sp.]|nr:hypothetical protein [Labilithrix sp.]